MLRLVVAAFLMSVPAAAQVVQPTNPGYTDTGCLIEGLDPGGDGFLALRTGPGSSHGQIGQVENGDALFLYGECQGQWCHAKSGVIGGARTELNAWFHTGWCQFYP